MNVESVCLLAVQIAATFAALAFLVMMSVTFVWLTLSVIRGVDPP